MLAQPLVLRAGQLGLDAAAAGRLARDGDVLRIAAEGRNVPLHPAGGKLLIQVTEIGGSLRRLAGQIGVRQEAEHVGAVVDRHHHNTPAGQTFAVKLHLVGRADHQAAAEVPYQHRQAFVDAHGGGPHVQVQAILIHGALRVTQPFLLIKTDLPVAHMGLLHGHGAEAVAEQLALPGRGRLRRAPAVFTHRRCGKGDSLVRRDSRICCGHTHQPACFHMSFPKHFSSFLSSIGPYACQPSC